MNTPAETPQTSTIRPTKKQKELMTFIEEFIADQPADVTPKQLKIAEEKWLVAKVELFFKEAERAPAVIEQELDKLYVLIGALKVLGLDGAAQSFLPRLSDLKKRHEDSQYAA
jgi:hypothetical protein